jgi:hypothetical protein
MATKTRKPTARAESDRDRLNIDLGDDRKRWEGAAAKLRLKLTPFIKIAVEEKIRRDGLG